MSAFKLSSFDQLLTELNLSDLTYYDLIKTNFTFTSPFIVIKKWNWDYKKCWEFQKILVDQAGQKSLRFLICCSHPRTLTNGRGLQKKAGTISPDLVQFNPVHLTSIEYPFYQIERGGGLTFHHPGQVILYPITQLNSQKISLKPLIDALLESCKKVLEKYEIQNLNINYDVLGPWYQHLKIASVGIAAHELISFHGLALNLISDDEFLKRLSQLSPCGLSWSSYSSVNQISHRQFTPQDLSNELIDEFQNKFAHLESSELVDYAGL